MCFNGSQSKERLFPYTVLTGGFLQGDSVASGPKVLSTKNYVFEIMTWKFIYTYRERCKTGPAHNRCWNWSPFTSKHTWMRFSKFWNTFPKFVWGPLARESPCITGTMCVYCAVRAKLLKVFRLITVAALPALSQLYYNAALQTEISSRSAQRLSSAAHSNSPLPTATSFASQRFT